MRITFKSILIVCVVIILNIIISCGPPKVTSDTSMIASDIYTYRINNFLDSAVLYCSDIYDNALEDNNLELLGIIYETVGIANLEAKNYPKGISYFEKAIIAYSNGGLDKEADNLSSKINDTTFKNNKGTIDTLSFCKNLFNSFQFELSGEPSKEEPYLLFIDMINAVLMNKKVDMAYNVYCKFNNLITRDGINNYYSEAILLLAQCYWDEGLGDSIINLSNEIIQVQNKFEFDSLQMENCNIIFWLAKAINGNNVSNFELTKNEESKLIQIFLKDSIYKNLFDADVINLANNIKSNTSDIISLAHLLDEKQTTYNHSLNLAINKFGYKELTREYLAEEKASASLRFTVILILFLTIVGTLIGYTLFLRWKSYSLLKENNANLRIEVMEKEMTQYELNLLNTIRDVQNAERRKVAMDMHDGITNTLTGLSLMATNIQSENSKIRTNNNDSWAFMESNLKNVIHELRAYTHTLNDDSYLPKGFKGAINDYIQVFKNGNTLVINEVGADICQALSKTRQYQLFRLIQELIANSIKHGDAAEINILFNLINESIQIKFTNNIIKTVTNDKFNGMGEYSINYRLNELHAFNVSQKKTAGFFYLVFNLPI